MNTETKIVADMKKLGFTEYEAKTYVSLLKENPVNGYTLSKNSGVPRSRIYETLETLKKKGVVFEHPGKKSTEYHPIAPNLLIESLKKGYSGLLENIENHLEKIPKKEQAAGLIVINGRNEILRFIKDMINSAEKRIALSIWHDELQEITKEIESALSRGIRLCGIYFGKNPIFDELTPHRRIDRYMAERRERFLTATIDSAHAVSGIVSRENGSRITCTTDRGFVEMSEDYICHDLMVNLYSEQLTGKAKTKYEAKLDMIRKEFYGYTDEEFERYEQQKKNHAIRWGAMRLAEYIGNCTKELQPEEIETFELEPITKRSAEVNALPSVVVVLQPQSQMEELGYNDLNYGWDTNRMLPTFMHPNEVLDGAMISGSFMPCSSKTLVNLLLLTEIHLYDCAVISGDSNNQAYVVLFVSNPKYILGLFIFITLFSFEKPFFMF